MKNFTMFLSLLSMIIVLGCAAGTVYESQPEVRTVEGSTFVARLEPFKDLEPAFDEFRKYQEPIFNAFRLAVENRSTLPLVVDWERSRYLHAGRPQGRFMFQGVNAENLHAPPSDTILPGETLSKVIWPVGLIAYAPYVSPSVRPGQSGFARGPLPQGENGIELVLVQEGKMLRQRLLVMIVSVAP